MGEGKERFTPGPWNEKQGNENIVVMSANPLRYAICNGPDARDNAALIAAAPEMYAKLQRVAERPAEIIEMLRREGFVFDNLEDRWQKIAFSLYTDLVELGSESENLLTVARGEDA